MVASCGGAARNAAPSDPAVVLSAVAPPQSPEPPSQADARAAPRKVAVESLEACVAQMRRASWLEQSAASDPARGDYFAALDQEQNGKLLEARRRYFQVIQQHPNSPYVVLAYLAFGEMFVTEAEQDPAKWPIAQQAFQEVVKYPPPDNHAWAYASYRLAMAASRTPEADGARALAFFKRATEASRSQPPSDCAGPVAAQAVRGMVESYAKVGRPEAAWAFFQSAVGDQTPDLMVDLAQEYLKANNTNSAVIVAQAVLDRQPPSASLCASIGSMIPSLRAGQPPFAGLKGLEALHQSKCR
jgi:tetratricopeptide (TPR) repeat protein